MATENTITKQIGSYLAGNGIGKLRETIFLRNMPVSPDRCVAVIPTGGYEPNHYLPLHYPTFQILVREKMGKEDVAESRAFAILDLLQSFGGGQKLNTGGDIIHFITALQEPTFLEYDENERPLFVFNIMVNYVGEDYSNLKDK